MRAIWAVAAAFALLAAGVTAQQLSTPSGVPQSTTITDPTLMDSAGVLLVTLNTQALVSTRSANAPIGYTVSNTNTGTLAKSRLSLISSATPGTAEIGNTSSGFTTAGGLAASTTYWTAGANGTGGVLIQSPNASGGFSVQTGGTTVGLTVSSAQQITLPGVTTGTNADFVCMSAGNILTLQTTACTISSRRYKMNIQPLESRAVDLVGKLEPVAFNMREDAIPNPDRNFPRRQIGLIAENVADADPRLAIYDDDGVTPKSYRQEAVIAVLVKAVQEQQREIDALKRAMRLP